MTVVPDHTNAVNKRTNIAANMFYFKHPGENLQNDFTSKEHYNRADSFDNAESSLAQSWDSTVVHAIVISKLTTRHRYKDKFSANYWLIQETTAQAVKVWNKIERIVSVREDKNIRPNEKTICHFGIFSCAIEGTVKIVFLFDELFI